MEKISNLFGLLTLFFYGLTMLNFVYKRGRNTVFKDIEWIKKYDKQLMKILVKNHKRWGFLAIAMLFIHGTLKFTQVGLNPVGALSASLLILQVILGLTRKYISVHRIIGFALAVSILVHVILK